MADTKIFELIATTLASINAGKGKDFAFVGLDFYVGAETDITAARADVANWISRRMSLSQIDLIVGQQGPPGNDGADGADGDPGPQGPTGAQGPAGVGVPTGGTAGQVLVKVNGVDFNTTWSTLTSLLSGLLVPSGGTTGQVLKKASNTNGDFTWQADNTGGGGGAATLPTFTYVDHGFTSAHLGCPFWYDTVANAPVIYDNNDPDHWMIGVIDSITDDDNFKYAPEVGQRISRRQSSTRTIATAMVRFSSGTKPLPLVTVDGTQHRPSRGRLISLRNCWSTAITLATRPTTLRFFGMEGGRRYERFHSLFVRKCDRRQHAARASGHACEDWGDGATVYIDTVRSKGVFYYTTAHYFEQKAINVDATPSTRLIRNTGSATIMWGTITVVWSRNRGT